MASIKALQVLRCGAVLHRQPVACAWTKPASGRSFAVRVVADGSKPSEGPSASRTTNNSWTSLATSSSTADMTLERLRKANRLDTLMAAKARSAAKKIWDADKLSAAVTAMMLLGLVTFGHNVVTQFGNLMQMPVEDLDAVAYFLLCFNIVSAVTGRPTQDGP